MSNAKFLEQLQWAKEKGLYFNHVIERKEVDGVYGMYAKEDIPIGTKLASYPVDQRLKPFSNVNYPEEYGQDVKQIHRACIEYQKGKDSDFYGFFLLFDNLNVFKQFSTYFFTEKELSIIQSLNKLLFKLIMEMKQLVDVRVARVCHVDKNVDPEVAQFITLNHLARSWDDIGFLPVLDCFNHSDRLGKERGMKNEEYLLATKIDYKKGDQIWISYSQKDMYHHCVNYHYFDPSSTHFINFGVRFLQTAKSSFEKRVARHCAGKYKLYMFEKDGVLYYRCDEPKVFFLETGPSLKLIDYIRDNCFTTEAELLAKKCEETSFLRRITDVLNVLLSMNRVDEFSLDVLPEKLHRFFYLLKKEKQILSLNKEWVTDSFSL